MKKVKTRHKVTGEIEIYDRFVADNNSNLEIIEEGDHLVEENEKTTMKLKSKKELREARRRRKMKKRQQSGQSEEKKDVPVGYNGKAGRLGYGEDEGDHVPHNMVSSILRNSR